MLDEKILNVLRTHTDSYVSGEDLTKLADISRSAIWKHMERLRHEGYEIEASPHLGYKLINIPDSLIPAEIRWKLKTKILGKQILSYSKTASTNDVAYELAEKGAREGVVILADEQTSGKGRHGRLWASPQKGGIYMSVILRPELAPNEIARITLLAAVAVAGSIRATTGLAALIKWPNDILINGRKVCGILTEMKAEQDRVNFLIVGIGINVNTAVKNLPKGATSLKEELHRAGRQESISRIDLTRRLLENIESEYLGLKQRGFKNIIDKWKDLSAMIGSRVRVSLPGRIIEGLCHTIDPDGALVVRLDSGVLEKVSSGDVVMTR